MSTIPGTLNIKEVGRHIVSKIMTQVFEVEILILYILNPLKSDIIEKYTIRSETPDLIDLNSEKFSSCLLNEVIQQERTLKYSNIQKISKYNAEIDGCPGIITRDLMCVPMKDSKNDDRYVILGISIEISYNACLRY